MTEKTNAPATTGATQQTEAANRSTQKEYSTNLILAIRLAKLDWYVFPCKADKKPLVTWKDKATKDINQIREWWQRWPDALIGVYCEKSGFFAVDLDCKNGANGLESWDDLVTHKGNNLRPPCGPIQKTPSGGMHILFRYPDNVKIPNNAGKLAPGIDLRSNGYICTGGAYEWYPEFMPEQPLTDAPAWLLDLIRNMKAETKPLPESKPVYQAETNQIIWASGLLDRLSLWRCDQYQDWVNVGMALSQLGEDGLSLWDSWSKKSAKYKPGECAAKWQSFKPGNGITLGSLYEWANKDNPQQGYYPHVWESSEEPPWPDQWPEDLDQLPQTVEQNIEQPTTKQEDILVPELPKGARIPENLLVGIDSAGQWLTDYVSFASKAAPMSAPEFHQILGLTLLATSIARRVKIRASTDEIYTNLYSLVVGSSGDKKSTATRLAVKILRMAKLNPLTLPGYMSPQGLLAELIGKQGENIDLMNDDAREAWQIKRSFSAQRTLMLEEAAALFEWFGKESMAGLKSLVLKLYDCPEEEGETVVSRGTSTAKNCYLNICGISTPTDLKPFLKDATHWGNGIWARFAFVTPSWEKPPYVFYPEPLDVPEELPKRLKRLFENLPQAKDGKPPEAITAELAPGVWGMWDAYYQAVGYDLIFSGDLSPRYHSSYKRFHGLAMKVALLLAAIDWADKPIPAQGHIPPPRVEIKHYVRGQIIAEQWRTSLHRLLENQNRDGQEESLETKALRKIPGNTSGEVITTRELAQKLNMSDQEQRIRVDRLVDQMEKDGLITRKKIKTRKASGWCKA